MIVADVNVLAYLLIKGEKTPQARAVWQIDAAWVLPDLWRDEFLNILTTYVRQGGTDLESAKALWTTAIDLFADKEWSADPLMVLELAQRFRLSAYDAQYLAVAIALDAKLLTEDRALRQAAPQHSLTMQAFLDSR